MKKAIILLVIVFLAMNVTIATDLKPMITTKVEMQYNGKNLLGVSVNKLENDLARIEIYSSDFELIHSQPVKKDEVKLFDVSKLPAGQYIVKVKIENQTVYSQVFRKTK